MTTGFAEAATSFSGALLRAKVTTNSRDFTVTFEARSIVSSRVLPA
jgi:hypothetical protein